MSCYTGHPRGSRHYFICGFLAAITAISVDRLLALLLGLRYRQVVTIKRVYAVLIAVGVYPGFGVVWQAVTAKSPSSFESWSNRLLILASYKSSMVRLEKEWANLVKRWLSLVWEASVLASEFSISC